MSGVWEKLSQCGFVGFDRSIHARRIWRMTYFANPTSVYAESLEMKIRHCSFVDLLLSAFMKDAEDSLLAFVSFVVSGIVT